MSSSLLLACVVLTQSGVDAALSKMDLFNPVLAQTAEDSLVKLGAPVITELRVRLNRSEGLMAQTLDGAIIRLESKFNPRQLVQKWVFDRLPILQDELNEDSWPKRIIESNFGGSLAHSWIYSVHFREFPAARMVPAPMKSRNVFIVSSDKKVAHLNEPNSMTQFALANLSDVSDLNGMFKSWLRVTEEFSQDGYFIFRIPANQVSVRIAGNIATAKGRVEVDPKGGDHGQIDVSMRFQRTAKGWKPTAITEKREVVAGVRPICQATKLLDPDPLVRRMAEQDILVMGRRCETYLRYIRPQLSPELQAEVDRIWGQIVREGR